MYQYILTNFVFSGKMSINVLDIQLMQALRIPLG